ncbi:MAG: hypothetical protein EP343_26280 [Deltaproteobacteria bacterium]|nr:MAG: hypothetical protein EP343_26280 [Deltaproteobacteria bacterium]
MKRLSLFLVCVLLSLTSWTGCLNLDFMFHNGVHCSKISDKNCKNKEYWDKVCLTCEQSYDFGRKYEWMDGTLKDGESIRPIDPSKVVRHQVKTKDGEGTLDAYFIPSHGEVPEIAKTTILYNHGNYAGIEHYMPRLHMLYEAGYNIVVWDYRGYGKSMPAKFPTQEQFLEDGKQIRDEAEKWAPDASKIIVYAYSLGGIPAVEMGIYKAGCAMFLEAPFTSARTLVRSASTANMPEGFFSEGRFNNIEKIKSYKGPLFVMIGSIDRTFTTRSAQELYDNAPGTKDFWLLEGVDHGLKSGGVPEAGFTAYKDKMLQFLKTKAPSCLAP